MKKLILFLIVVSCICCSCGFYTGLNGKVVDNVTGQPLEGAVVVAQWTKPRGIPGLQYHDLHKIIETLTDKEGSFSLSGTFGVLIDPPEMLIYKKGYIPWRNDMVFPGGHITKDHEWNNDVTYKLDVFTDKYTYRQLYSFLDYGMIGNGRSEVPIISNSMREISMKDKAEIKSQSGKDNK
jgi:hypothetical protein